MGADAKPRILIVDPIDDRALHRLRESYDVVTSMQPPQDVLAELIAGADVLIMRSGVKVDDAILAAAPRLKIIARAGSGVDNIALESARARGIAVFNAPNAGCVSVAEFTFGALISLTRRIALADRQMHGGLWKKAELYGVELRGRTIGIVGCGRIGLRVARIAQGFSMRVQGVVENCSDERRAALKQEGIEMTQLPEALEQCDVVCLHVPLTNRTRHLISLPQLQAMKKDAYLVNMSRGGVVDEAALHYALTRGIIAGAASDVFQYERRPSPLFGLDNLLATPHIASMTAEAQGEIGEMLIVAIAAGLSGAPIPNRIV